MLGFNCAPIVKQMSFDEAVDMPMKEAGMSKDGAVAEVHRYTLTPAYPLSYLLGEAYDTQTARRSKAKDG